MLMIYLKLSDELVSCGNELRPYNFVFFYCISCPGLHRIAISAKNIYDASYEELCVAYVYIYVFFTKKGIPQCTASYVKKSTQKRYKIPTETK